MMRGRGPVGILVAATVLVAASPMRGTGIAPVAPIGFIVVVHADNPATTIEREELSKMFFKRVVKWPDGRTAEPVDLAVSQPARVSFTAGIHKKSVGAVRAFWQQQIFSGREIPPVEKRDDAEVMAFVTETLGAVGYVSSGTHLTSGVKSLTVLGVGSP